VLLDEGVDLGGAPGRQSLDELVDRLGAVWDRLGACHGPSVQAWSDTGCPPPTVPSAVAARKQPDRQAVTVYRTAAVSTNIQCVGEPSGEPCSGDTGLFRAPVSLRELPSSWGFTTSGDTGRRYKAPWHGGGQGFESPQLHKTRNSRSEAVPHFRRVSVASLGSQVVAFMYGWGSAPWLRRGRHLLRPPGRLPRQRASPDVCWPLARSGVAGL
jgi:hypothetical protein